MPRNLVRRIELLTGIADEECAARLLRILRLQCKDNMLSHELQMDGSYHKVKINDEEKINNQKMVEEYIANLYKAHKKESPNSVQQLAQRLFKDS
jgi:polyphosphate kinase